jgi:hypothetical protein
MIGDVEVRDAGSKGRGVYARRAFDDGEFIFRRRHIRILTAAELDRAADWERVHLCELGFDRFAVLAPPGCYLNHSCDPNAMRHGVKVFAWRPIEKGEEITIDYRLNAFDGSPWPCGVRRAELHGHRRRQLLRNGSGAPGAALSPRACLHPSRAPPSPTRLSNCPIPPAVQRSARTRRVDITRRLARRRPLARAPPVRRFLLGCPGNRSHGRLGVPEPSTHAGRVRECPDRAGRQPGLRAAGVVSGDLAGHPARRSGHGR